MKDNIAQYKLYKKQFLELYKDSKNYKIDLYTLPPETLEKMCTLLEEEIKIKEEKIRILKSSQLNN